jgi:hypothetical protein
MEEQHQIRCIYCDEVLSPDWLFEAYGQPSVMARWRAETVPEVDFARLYKCQPCTENPDRAAEYMKETTSEEITRRTDAHIKRGRLGRNPAGEG